MAIYGYVCPDPPQIGANVYFIRNGRGDVKIGVAKDVARRRYELQLANPDKLEVFFSLHINDESEAYKIEKALHHKFSSVKKRGEWFHEEKVINWLRNGDTHIAGWTFENIDW